MDTNELSLRVVSLNVGQPAELIVSQRGRTVPSSIAKRPVRTRRVKLGLTNLQGDKQADLTVHGGYDKAVYVYPQEHFAFWHDALGRSINPGNLGENVTVVGALEDAVCIDDIFNWGDAIVQVSKPRQPCFKLDAFLGSKEAGRLMASTGYCGWYLRVLKEGFVPAEGVMTLTGRTPEAPTVRARFFEKMSAAK